MKKDLGPMPALFPMPVLMIGTYSEEGKVDVMNAAWGQICDSDKIFLSLTKTHKTVANLNVSKAFTVALADEAHMDVADYFGIASGNRVADKFERTGYHAVKSDKVNAPIIEEFPLTMECELLDIIEFHGVYGVVGQIVNVKANEEILDENGKVSVEKMNALMFDQFQNGYYVVGRKAGQAWNAGVGLMKEG